MKLEQQVCSLELSQKLKELGVKQESLFYWQESYSTSHLDIGKQTERKVFNVGEYRVVYLPKPRYETANLKDFPLERAKIQDNEVSAFTVAELGEMLPQIEIPHPDEEVRKARREMGESELVPAWTTSGRNSDGEYFISVGENGQSYYDFTAPTEADVRALMLQFLIEQGLITTK